MTRIESAKLRHEQAAKELMRVVREQLPYGTRLEVKLGRATVRGRVIGHATSWWYSPDEVRIENEVTGKIRHFAAGDAESYPWKVLR